MHGRHSPAEAARHEIDEHNRRATACLRSEPAQAFALASGALHAARARNYRRGAAMALIPIAECHRMAGRFAEAREAIEQADAIAARLRDTHLSIALAQTKGTLAIATGDHGDVPAELERAVVRADRAGSVQRITLRIALGLCREQAGDYPEALRTLHAAADIAEADAANDLLAQAYAAVGNIHSLFNNAATARHYLRRAHELHAVCGDRMGCAATLTNLGVDLEEHEEYAEALGCFERALAIASELNALPLVALLHANIGTIHEHAGRPAQALEFLRRAAELAGPGTARPTPDILRCIGRALAALDRREEALTELGRALAAAEAMRDESACMETHEELARLHERYDDPERAAEHWERHRTLADRLFGRTVQRAYAEITMRNELRAGALEAERLRANLAARDEALQERTRRLAAMAIDLGRALETLARLRADIDQASGERLGKRKAAALVARIDAELASGESWRRFEEQFHAIHPEFAARLAAHAPDITPMELRVCRLMKLGLPSKQIAAALSIAPHTVHTHRRNIRRKLALRDRHSLPRLLAEL